MGDVIKINLAEIEAAAQKLKQEAGEMEAAIQAAENAISPLRSMTSTRLSADLADWDQIKRVTKENLTHLVEAATQLSNTARDFRTVDQA